VIAVNCSVSSALAVMTDKPLRFGSLVAFDTKADKHRSLRRNPQDRITNVKKSFHDM
jgi:hypothetical protein